MDRRSFLQLAAGTGLASLGPNSLSAEPGLAKALARTVAEPQAEPSVLQELGNEFLKVFLHSDGSASIFDIKNQATWRMGPVAFQEDSPIDRGEVWLRSGRSICEQYPAASQATNRGKTCDSPCWADCGMSKARLLSALRWTGHGSSFV